ncbi:TIGR03618 family F420-dependent PPOX class oxidoreductase [Segeticoccus rhizosphaerae]|uniref:TIGR03618 family F420-dependent PPOX class oxidoreductase n=2 Tax=Segeticoccus rhizosphaerae TaxID=1104777 RepID=UPI0010C069A1
MPAAPLSADALEMLRQPNPAVITSVRADGQPVSVATWYLVEEDGRILVNMDARRARLKYLRADPRVSLTALAEGNWYDHVSVQGRVVEFADDTDLSDIDRLSRLYGGDAYPNRERPRVSAWIEVERWHGWGAYS